LPVAVKINGAGAAPQVEITTPSGRVIMPPAAGNIGEKISGVGMLLENGPGHATVLLLTKPAKGRWHVTPVSGSVPVTSIETAKALPPPEVLGAAKSLSSGKVGLGVAYSLAAGEKMTLYVAGPHHGTQVLGVAKGRACPGAGHAGPGAQLCEHITFTPTYGPSGKRTISGAVTNSKGLPVANVKIASVDVRFPKAAATKPAIIRHGTRALVEWLPVPRATRYALGVILSDGRKLSFTTTRTSVTVTGLTKSDTIKATVWPVMPDGVIGNPATAKLKSGSTGAGSKSVKPSNPTPKPASAGTIQISGVASANGVYDVRAGTSYSLVVRSQTAPTYVYAAPAPQAPHGGQAPFLPDGSSGGLRRWLIEFSLPAKAADFSDWNAGVQIGGRLYVVHIHLT
jgi:hypothetical protein